MTFDNQSLIDKMVEHAYEVRSNSKPTHEWNCTTYSSFGVHNLSSDGYVFEAIKSVTEVVAAFADHHAARYSKVECTEGWYNIAKTGDYQEYHIHPNFHFSAVLYLQTPENCGDIVFRSPSYSNMLPIPVLENNEANSKLCYYKPSRGLILCFRSDLYHMVLPNKSANDRITAAFNFRLI